MADAKRGPVNAEDTWGANTVRKQEWLDKNAVPVRTATEKANKEKESGE